jgi:hypothetical protein
MTGRNNSRDLDANGRIILKCILKKEDMKVWIEIIWLLAQDRDKQWANVRGVIANLRVAQEAGKFVTSSVTIISQAELYLWNQLGLLSSLCCLSK